LGHDGLGILDRGLRLGLSGQAEENKVSPEADKPLTCARKLDQHMSEMLKRLEFNGKLKGKRMDSSSMESY
jgi:hypothetical protein